jgi:alpha-amylase/alpha-mannosidase (GH57 family)
LRQQPLSVVIHGHFYQPPREDPWLEEVPHQPSAAPYHDWNERVERECYRAVVASRILDRQGHIRGILNALEWLSFDFGPTLLSWLEREAPDTYAAVLEADLESCRRLDGHGNAMAMAYHHPILPLSDPRDRVTEVRWGIADFRRRFGRDPEGMWLPETAVDADSLDVLAAEGIRFTILAPHQVSTVPTGGRPGRYVTPSGRDIAIFVYDGGVAHDVAFGHLLKDGAAWADRLATFPEGRGKGASRPRLRSMATDGETFGHHHRFGEMALATALEHLRARDDVVVESYASFLARHEPREEVELVAPTAWSCAHGVERWRSDCGCKASPEAESDQSWRGPLRDALTWLAGELHRRYERETAPLLTDPWSARNDYVGTLTPDREATLRPFLERWSSRELSGAEGRRVVEMLEMERNALRLFTSCAWFFDDVAGIEARQVLTYAARAIDLYGEGAGRVRDGLVARLEKGASNDADVGTAGQLYLRSVAAAVPAQLTVAAAAQVVRRLGGGAVQRWGAYTVSVGTTEVSVVHRPTGRSWKGVAEVVGAGPSTLEARVTMPPEPTSRVIRWDDLPVAVQEHLASALALSAQDLSPDTDGAFTHTGPRAVQIHHLHDSLRKVIDVLEERPEPGPPGVAPVGAVEGRLERILDALEALEEGVPYDAETRLWRLLGNGEGRGEGQRELSESVIQDLRRRLGFAVSGP